MEYVLEARGITKRFPGVLALDHADLQLRKGEVHALVGENGAGKSTLMHILSGVYKKDEGQIFINDKEVEINSPTDATNLGIGIVFQELSLIPELSVAENMFPNRQPVNKLGFINNKQLLKNAQQIIDIFEEDIDPATPVKFLTIAKQQMVEIMKALSHDPKVLILDEPTSSLTQVETERLFRNIETLKERGISMVYISHHLSEVMQVADVATVLRDGKIVTTVNVSEINEDKLVSFMVGREIVQKHIDRTARIDRSKLLFEAKNLSHLYQFKDISFDVYPGEIVGMYGLVGAGRSEMAKCIFGLDKLSGGEMYLDGKPFRAKSAADSIEKGVAYASENRKLDGLFLKKTISDNCVSVQLKSFANKIGFLNDRDMGKFADDCIKRLNVITPSRSQITGNLSGGNQQKVLLSMWLGVNPRFLIVDEPTKGVDVGAKSEIYDILRKLADEGMGILVISSDLLEILNISDRIFVIKDGRVQGECMPDEAKEEKTMTEKKKGSFSIRKLFEIRESALVVLIIIFAVIMVCVKPKFLSINNILAIFISLSSTATLACGMCVLLVSGCMDLSVGSMSAFSGVICCQLMNSFGVPVVISIVAGVLLGLIVGLINGFIVVKWNIAPFIITLGMQYILRGLTQIIAEGFTIIGLPESFTNFGQKSLLGIQLPILYMIVLVVVFEILLRKFRFFRQSYFLGGNEKAAGMTGMKTKRIKVVNFIIVDMLAAFVGVTFAARFGNASVTIGTGLEMQVITACVIGGASLSGGEGTIIGAFLGALLMAMITSALNMLGVDTFWQNVCTGAILIFAVVMDTILKDRRELGVKVETAKKRDEKIAA